MEYITFEIDDFFTNAGLIGLAKILEKIDKEKKHYRILEQHIEVEKNFLLKTDLTDAFFETLICEYRDELSFTVILNRIIQVIDVCKKIEFDSKSLKEDLKFIKDRLSASSYKTAYEIITKQVEDENKIFDLLKNITNLKEKEALEDSLTKIYTYLQIPEVNKTFYMKNIAYSIINRFWENKSFLNYRSNSKKDMKEIHQKEIENPFKEYLRREKEGKEYCAVCGSDMSPKEKQSFTFLKDSGDDLGRKKSPFWNFVPDKFVCPKCMFLYTLIPLGFVKVGNDFLFVNNNASVQTLIDLNGKSKTTDDQVNNLKYYEIFNHILLQHTEKKIYQLFDIEVITKYADSEHYRFDVIRKDILTLLNEAKDSFRKLAVLHPVKIKEVYYNIYVETLGEILKNNDLYALILTLLTNSLNKDLEYLKKYVLYLLQIQYKKESIIAKEEKMNSKTKCFFAAKRGKELREVMINGEKDDSSIIGITYKMLNALKKEDSHEFIDIIVRLCNTTKRMVPTGLIDTLEDAKSFKNFGYAFVLGFRGGLYEKEGENENE